MTRDPNCIFCKIVAGQIPAQVVMANEHAVAFLDIQPLAIGHLLLVPVEHHSRLDQMPAELAGRVCSEIPRLAEVLVKVTSADGYNVLLNNGRVAGQVVDHVHIHLVPRKQGDGLGYRWNTTEYPPGQAEQLAQRLKTELA